MTPRTPQTCRYRRVDALSQEASCELLSTLYPPGSANGGVVSLEVCQACCRGFEPSERDFNPVIASLVWSRAAEQLSDPESSHREQWAALHQQAEVSLPPVLPEEDDLPVVDSTPVESQQPLERVLGTLPIPAQRVGKVTRWAVGVTTAPRRSATLETCLRTFAGAGWPQPHLFIDGEVEIAAEFACLMRTVRTSPVGARQSYFLAIQELLQIEPQADALMLVQDDSLWPSHLPIRDYLEAALWPGPELGLVSAWCCTDDTAPSAGWHAIARPWRFGAVAFVFPRVIAERFVADDEIQQLCSCDPQTPTAGISMLVGDWAARHGIPVYFPTPSIVQHIGEVSAIFEHSRAVGVRWASRYLGDEVRS